MVDVPVDYERPAASSLFGRAMVSPDLKERMNEVVRRVFSNVHGYWLDYGETDFPNDLGIRFRNDFVKFVLNFDHDINDPVPDDKFFPTNISLLEKLSVDQLLRVIGTLHLYSVSRDYCVRSRNIRSFSNSLNWVFNAYEFPGSASCEWFELAKKNNDQFAFVTGQEKMYSEVAAILGADPRDKSNEAGWSGFAIVLAHGHNSDDQLHDNCCREIFGDS